jgi:hypothetical protein
MKYRAREGRRKLVREENGKRESSNKREKDSGRERKRESWSNLNWRKFDPYIVTSFIHSLSYFLRL